MLFTLLDISCPCSRTPFSHRLRHAPHRCRSLQPQSTQPNTAIRILLDRTTPCLTFPRGLAPGSFGLSIGSKVTCDGAHCSWSPANSVAITVCSFNYCSCLFGPDRGSAPQSRRTSNITSNHPQVFLVTFRCSPKHDPPVRPKNIYSQHR